MCMVRAYLTRVGAAPRYAPSFPGWTAAAAAHRPLTHLRSCKMLSTLHRRCVRSTYL
jgi:hypothetical protein